jgi:hypothetical protein
MVILAAKFPDPVARYLANGKRGLGRILGEKPAPPAAA